MPAKELLIKKVNYRISPAGVKCDMDLGEISLPFGREIVEQIKELATEKELMQSNIKQISEEGGWFSAGETWTYASADAPTFTFRISGDKTIKYSPGMRIKLTQTTVKFFIITAVSYSAPNTTVTIYGGTDYTLANAAITSPFYSSYKAPFGFPLNPAKWTIEVTDETSRSQASPTANVWYNLGSISIVIPIGIWGVEYFVAAYGLKTTATAVTIRTTLSTANNSESDSEMTAYISITGASGTLSVRPTTYRRKIILLSSKTTYYINTLTSTDTVDEIYNVNNLSKLIIRAICAYL